VLQRYRPSSEVLTDVGRAFANLIYYTEKGNLVTTTDLQSTQDELFYLDDDIQNGASPHATRTIQSFNFTVDNTQLEHQQYSFRRESVTTVSDVALIGEYGVGVTADSAYLEDLITNSSVERTAGAIKFTIREHPTLAASSLENRIYGPRRETLPTIELGCSLYNKWTNYYHWIIEHLLKLRHVERYEKAVGETPMLIIPPDPPKYITETLSLLGYSRSDWVVWSDPGIRVDSLVVPTYPEPTPGNLSWLRSQLQQQVEPATDEPSRIYISRDRSDKRLVENEHEVREVVAEFGFEPYFLEELTVEEQVRLFGSADAVVGPHGAGLTNVIWGDDLTVFELFPEDVYDLYGVISSLLGHAYHGLQFTSVTPRLGINSNLNVDVDALHSYLDSNLSD